MALYRRAMKLRVPGGYRLRVLFPAAAPPLPPALKRAGVR